MAEQLQRTARTASRRAAGELLRMLGHVTGPDEPATCQLLLDLRAGIEERQEHWPGLAGASYRPPGRHIAALSVSSAGMCPGSWRLAASR